MTLTAYLNSQFSIIQELDFFCRILLACLCGACIGMERSKRLKEAGVRTHVIVCCAAALMIIVSKYGFADLTSESGAVFNGTRGADPARIAAQVVSGISFLGAGVIFKHGSSVKGLTTAAGIWATAGIGLAIGSGMFIVGIFSTAVIAVIQILMHRFTVGVDATSTSRLQFTLPSQCDLPPQFISYIAEHRIQVVESSVTKDENGCSMYDFVLRSPKDITMDDMMCIFNSSEVLSSSCLLVH